MLKVHFQTFIVKNLIVMSVNRYFITICDDEKRRKLFGRISLPGLDPGFLRHPQFTLTTALVAVARKAQRVRGLSPSTLAKNGLANDPSFALCRGFRVSCSSAYHDVR